jgi:uncharacterized damage-inducible protein DinB
MNVRPAAFYVAVLAVLFIHAGTAQQKSTDVPSGFCGEFLGQMEEVEQKFLELADAMPASKYQWRPGKDVRSFSEVLVHVAVTNYMFPRSAGVQPPPGMTPDLEKRVTDRTKVRTMLKSSFEHLRKAVTAMEEQDLSREANLFGRTTTVRDVYFTLGMHMHEHLGQLIAYARMNGIVPPWSSPRDSRAKD